MNKKNKNPVRLIDDSFYKHSFLQVDKETFDETEKSFWKGYEEGFENGKEAIRRAQSESKDIELDKE